MPKKLTEKKLCDICENVSKVQMLQSGKGITQDILKGIKGARVMVKNLSKDGKKIVKEATKLFNEGKMGLEQAVGKVKPFVEDLLFKKGKGFTTADFSQHFGSGYMPQNIPLGQSHSVGQGGVLPGHSGSGGILAGASTGSGGKLAGKKSCGSGGRLAGHSTGGMAVMSSHSVVNRGRGKKTNPWIEHLKAYRAKNPGVSYKDAMKKAKLTYKKK
jgi:hypothetical protein